MASEGRRKVCVAPFVRRDLQTSQSQPDGTAPTMRAARTDRHGT